MSKAWFEQDLPPGYEQRHGGTPKRWFLTATPCSWEGYLVQYGFIAVLLVAYFVDPYGESKEYFLWATPVWLIALGVAKFFRTRGTQPRKSKA